MTVVVSGLRDTHKSWWECDTGIAYLVSGVPDWRTRRMTQIYDLSDPAKPVFIRNFGLPGQQPGSTGPVPTESARRDLHGTEGQSRLLRLRHRRATASCRSSIANKLLNGPKEPTDANLVYPQVVRLDLPPTSGAHTAFPMLGMQLPEFAQQKLRPGTAAAAGVEHDHDDAAPERTQARRDFIAVVGETTGQRMPREPADGADARHHRPRRSRSACRRGRCPRRAAISASRGGRFGTHSSNENLTPIYYNRVLFVAHFNAGVRALDVRDPFNRRKSATTFRPSPTRPTSAASARARDERCKIAIQTNNVEVDDRGYIYIVDRANTGMHILELTGRRGKVANFQ